MNDMKRKSPREFWNMFRETKRTIGEYVSVEDVVEHFKNLASHHSETNREVHDEKVRSGEANTRFEELDSHIYEDEIRKASKQLKKLDLLRIMRVNLMKHEGIYILCL